VGIVPLIFKNLTESNLVDLERNLVELEQTPEEEIATITELDLEFHRLLCQISGNSLIIKVNRILVNLFRKSMEDVVIALGNQTGRKYHRRIFAAISEGDQQKTAALVEEHIENTIESIERAKLKK
jgi:GntR family transcriptional repressor for pyruvate dehydrogenase complex